MDNVSKMCFMYEDPNCGEDGHMKMKIAMTFEDTSDLDIYDLYNYFDQFALAMGYSQSGIDKVYSGE